MYWLRTGEVWAQEALCTRPLSGTRISLPASRDAQSYLSSQSLNENSIAIDYNIFNINMIRYQLSIVL